MEYNIKNLVRSDFREISKLDAYLINYFDSFAIDSVIDIGANVGVFSAMMKFKHPNSRVIAVEPCPKAFNVLKDIAYVMDIETYQLAIGNGGIVEDSRDNEFSSTLKDSDSGMNTVTMPWFFKKRKINTASKYLIKIDTEGSERFLVNDKESELIISNSIQTSLEIHFRTKKNNDKFYFWPEYNFYQEWINDCFSKSHNVLYYKSSRDNGYGHYCLRRKDFEQKPLWKRQL